MKLRDTQIQTISSREVAEMMDVRHGDLLEKIDKINKDLKNGKIRCSKYWIKSTYKQTGNGKENREYQVTKLGCEFLAHKTTGTRGNLFTARYMDKFEEMKVEIARDSYMIQDPIQRALAWAEEEKVRQKQQKQLEQQKPLVDAYKQFLDVGDNMDFGTLAKHIGIGRNKIMAQLREWKVLMTDEYTVMGVKQTGDKHNQPYQKYVDKGYFIVKHKQLKTGQYKPVTLVTPLGATAITKELSKRGII